MRCLLNLFLLSIMAALAGLSLAQTTPGVTRERPPDRADFELSVVASGFERPVYATHADDGSGRLFLVEQVGKIWILRDGVVSPQPFLDISGLISRSAHRSNFTEQGLLGLAFHPDFAANGRFFVNYTDLNGDTAVARYLVDAANPERADAASRATVLQLRQPYSNHNGGHIEFGPDGYLYIALGDGGSANDPLGAGQNLGLLLGSILRLDVDVESGYAIPPDNPFVGVAGARAEIWAYGLRNVWRHSFDRATGDLYMADVGQNQWEEINFQPADSPGGQNYGWNVWEGNHIFAGGSAPNHVPPVYEYSHALGCSVTGGSVYRGKAIPSLEAVYVFGDWCSGRVWGAWRDPEYRWNAIELLNTGFSISSFGEDEAGEIYLIDYDGTLYRFEPGAA